MMNHWLTDFFGQLLNQVKWIISKYHVDGFYGSNYSFWNFSKSCVQPTTTIALSWLNGRGVCHCVLACLGLIRVLNWRPESPSLASLINPLPRRQAGSSRSDSDHRFFENPARSSSRRGFCLSCFVPVFRRFHPKILKSIQLPYQPWFLSNNITTARRFLVSNNWRRSEIAGNPRWFRSSSESVDLIGWRACHVSISGVRKIYQ